MSTKTLRKRIALVAVSALGAGLLSVVAVPSANAAIATSATYDFTGTAGAAGVCANNTSTNVMSVVFPAAGTNDLILGVNAAGTVKDVDAGAPVTVSIDGNAIITSAVVVAGTPATAAASSVANDK